MIPLLDLPALTGSAIRREDFFRLKKVQGKKKRDAEKGDNERTKQNREYEDGGGGEPHKDDGIGGGDAGGTDMLGEGKDEDVIF